jgi:hypothetical protein
MFARSLIGVLAVIASAGCDLPVDALGKDHGDSRPMTREDAYIRQLDLDVAAIIGGMARAHGAQVVSVDAGTLAAPSRWTAEAMLSVASGRPV